MGPDSGVFEARRDETVASLKAEAEPNARLGAMPGLQIRWLMWSILAGSYLIVFFHRVAPGVVADRMMADFSIGGAEVGFVTAIYFYVYAAMQIPSGVLADTLGVRRTVTIGASLTALGSVILGLAPTLEVSYLGRFLVGLGVSVIFVSAMKFMGNWFRPGEFGTVSGLLVLIGAVGAVAGTTPVAVMAELLGWRLSFVVVGLATGVLALAAWRWVRGRPSDLGLPSPHDPGPTAGHAGSVGSSPAKGIPFRVAIGIVWRNRQTWAAFTAQFGLFGAYLTLSGLWGVPYLMHVYGFDRVQAANHLLVAPLGMLISAPLAGFVSDRIRSRKLPIMVLATLACAAWLALVFWNSGKPPAWALYPIFGALGSSTAAVTLIMASVKEANPPALSGLAMGTANNSFLCAAILQPAVGYLLDQYWQGAMQEGARVYPGAGYLAALSVMTGLALIGWLGALLLKETHCAQLPQRRDPAAR